MSRIKTKDAIVVPVKNGFAIVAPPIKPSAKEQLLPLKMIRHSNNEIWFTNKALEYNVHLKGKVINPIPEYDHNIIVDKNGNEYSVISRVLTIELNGQFSKLDDIGKTLIKKSETVINYSLLRQQNYYRIIQILFKYVHVDMPRRYDNKLYSKNAFIKLFNKITTVDKRIYLNYHDYDKINDMMKLWVEELRKKVKQKYLKEMSNGPKRAVDIKQTLEV